MTHRRGVDWSQAPTPCDHFGLVWYNLFAPWELTTSALTSRPWMDEWTDGSIYSNFEYPSSRSACFSTTDDVRRHRIGTRGGKSVTYEHVSNGIASSNVIKHAYWPYFRWVGEIRNRLQSVPLAKKKTNISSRELGITWRWNPSGTMGK